MTDIKLSEDITVKLIKEGDRNIELVFNTFEPFFCKLCDDATPLSEQKKHFADHKKCFENLKEQRRKDAEEKRKRARELEREVNTTKVKKRKKK